MSFPDLAHLRQLQTDLWRWPSGRAAVMVGAGFTLNAEPLPGTDMPLPTWRQLVRSMFDELHPREPDEAPDKREARFNAASPLWIASEYEAALVMGESLGSVEWTHDEAKQLYFNARDEWTNEKRALEIARDSPFFSTTSPNFDAPGEFLASTRDSATYGVGRRRSMGATVHMAPRTSGFGRVSFRSSAVRSATPAGRGRQYGKNHRSRYRL